MTVLRWLKPPLRAARAAWRQVRARLGAAPAGGASPEAAPRHAAPPTPSPTAAPTPRPASPVSIEVEETPNPNARKLTVDRVLLPTGSVTATGPEDASHPVALALLAVPGVRSVFLARDFVTVTRDPSASWGRLEPALVDALSRSLS